MSFADVVDRTMRAPSARRGLLAGALVAGALAVLPAGAGAIVTHGPNGPIGYMPLNNSAEAKAAAATRFAANGNLDYNGGPVMPSNKQFAIFWAPAGFSFPAGYQAGIIKFLKNVSAVHNLPVDTYSVGAQYKDQSGKFATSSMSFGGSVTDTNPIPANGCPPYVSPISGFSFTQCITDAQLFAEVNSVVAAQGGPRGLTNQYFMFLPPGVGSCFDATGTACFDKEFCAYHSASGAGPTVYANESFTPVDPAGCGTGNYPNGKASGIDDELSSLSHETNEAREDPELNAWFNSTTGAEGADQCRNTADDYGTLLGGTPGVNGFNQNINGGHYMLQRDWSNASNGCEQFYHLTGQTFGPFKSKVGQKVEFSVKFKDFEGGHLATGAWKFGDGAKANGLKVSHKYTKTGKYHVKLTACTNTKVCLFGNRVIKVTKKKKHHHHHRVAVAAVPLHQAR
jgi:hypothetical protein